MDEIVDEGVGMSSVDMKINPSFYSNTKIWSNDVDQVSTGSNHTKDNSEFIRGYIDCAQESIRFLTDEEGMSVDHPFIKDLQTGLLKHIQILQIQLLLREVIELESEEEDADTDSESCDECEESESIHRTANLVPEQLQEFNECLPSPQELDNEAVTASIAEKIYNIVCHLDTENEEYEVSDIETSNDEGFHEH